MTMFKILILFMAGISFAMDNKQDDPEDKNTFLCRAVVDDSKQEKANIMFKRMTSPELKLCAPEEAEIKRSELLKEFRENVLKREIKPRTQQQLISETLTSLQEGSQKYLDELYHKGLTEAHQRSQINLSAYDPSEKIKISKKIQEK